MTKARTFTRTEIMDAARAAAETGLNVRLLSSGTMEFYHGHQAAKKAEPTPEELLQGWLDSKGRENA